MKVDKVNTYGLVYELKGSDEAKKPILLTGHQGRCLNNKEGKAVTRLMLKCHFPKMSFQWNVPP